MTRARVAAMGTRLSLKVTSQKVSMRAASFHTGSDRLPSMATGPATLGTAIGATFGSTSAAIAGVAHARATRTPARRRLPFVLEPGRGGMARCPRREGATPARGATQPARTPTRFPHHHNRGTTTIIDTAIASTLGGGGPNTLAR